MTISKAYKTNINCGGCLKMVTPFIEDVDGIDTWAVDTDSTTKTLTVTGDFRETDLFESVEEAGFDIERLN